ncbi:hypothetical protein [Pseudonocardia sp.]|uniref:hypothetical protein n=1 Tax=Pseudonocardia sp. TaxID=60912 RepID=UPI003D0D423C
MSDEELVVLVHALGTPDATGAPGLLIGPALVLVPGPPGALLGGQALEAVLAANPLDGEGAVERQRVSAVHTYSTTSTEVVTSLLAVLEHPSCHAPWDIGAEPDDAELADFEGDLWRALAGLGRIPDGDPPQADVAFLRRLPEVEAAQRRPQWNPVDDEAGEDQRRWWPRHLFRR